MDKPRIETERLILRPFKSEDAEEYFRMTRDEDIQKYVPGACPETFADCLHDVYEIYSKGDLEKDFYLIIEEKKSGKMIGAIICVLIHDFDTSYFISPSYRHKGYMHEALCAFIRHMKKGGALAFKVHVDNWQSYSVLQDIPGIEHVYNCDNNKEILCFRKIL